VYGVPADLDLSRFIGATLEQVALGRFQIQFHFHPDAEIGVEGRWALRGRSGRLIDEIFDSSSGFESFSIQPGDIFI
jgi:hypothetical protein